MPAHVGESAHSAIVATDDNHAFAKIFQAAPFARIGDLAFMANDLRRGSKEGFLLRFEEFRIMVEPARQAHVVQWIGGRLDRFEVRRHVQPLPFRGFCGNGRGSGAKACPSRWFCFERQPEGRAIGVRQRSAKRET